MNEQSPAPEQNNGTNEKILAEAQKFNKFQKIALVGEIVGKIVKIGAILTVVTIVVLSNMNKRESRFNYTTVIEVTGPITAGNADNNSEIINKKINKAFAARNSRGVILKLNSPGGSPVEANIIYKNIVKNKAQHSEKKIYALVGDICASGCYYIATAADGIFADDNSIIGSIGAVWSGFGFVDALDKLGIERRVITSVKNKSMLDPFKPINKQDQSVIEEIVKGVHENFVNTVIETRGGKIDKNRYAEAFSGKIFLSEKAIALGLIDGINDLETISYELIKSDRIHKQNKMKFLLENYLKAWGAEVLATFFAAEIR